MDEVKGNFEELANNIESEIQRLSSEKKRLDTEIRNLKRERENPQNYNFKQVLLDVGGYKYATTLETLLSVPGSYFFNLFSGPIPEEMKTHDGRIFLDRNGKLFRYVLNCLRNPNRFVLRLRNRQDLDELREETIFYGIEDIVFANSLFIPDSQNWLDEKKISIKAFSTEHSDYYGAKNILDYSKTYWLSLPGTITDQWLVFDFEKEAYISKISIKVDSFECTVKDFNLQYSENDDCQNWVVVKDFQAKVGNQCTEEQFFDGFEFRGRYMRFFCKNNWGPGGGNFILVTNIKFYGALQD